MLRPFGSLSTATSVAAASISSTPVSKRVVPPDVAPVEVEPDLNGSASFVGDGSPLGITAGDTSDSKDSQNHRDDLPKEWLFFEDMDINEVDELGEPKSPGDDEFDYDPRYGSKKRRKRRQTTRKSLPYTSHTVSDGPRKGRPPGGGVSGGRGRGRRRAAKDKKYSVDPPSPRLVEPPSFASAAAAVSSDYL